MNYRTNSFSQLPDVVKNLIIINILFFIASNETDIGIGDILYENLALWSINSGNFSPYQLITYSFLHAPISSGYGFQHLIFNMFPIYIFGRVLENVWGSKRFLTFYLITGIFAGFIQLLIGDFGYTVGASGAVFGLLAGFGMLFPNTKLFLLFPPIPIKAKYFVVGYALIELFAGVFPSQGDNVAHFAHLGGAFAGFLLILYWRKSSNNFF